MSETIFQGARTLQEAEDQRAEAEDHRIEAPASMARRLPARAIGRRAYWIRRITLVTDLAALGAALAIAAGLVAVLGRPALDSGDFLLFAGLVPLWVLLANHFGLYHLPERTDDWSFADDLSSAFVVCSIWACFWLFARSAIETGATDVLLSMVVWAGSIAIIPIFRSSMRVHLRSTGWYRQSVLLVGSPVGVDRVLRRIRRQPDWCLDVVETVAMDGRFDVAARSADVSSLARSLGVGRVIVAGGPVDIAERTRMIRDLLELGVYVDLVSSEADVFRPTAFINHLEGLPTLAFSPVRLSPSAKLIKRAIDISCASFLLVVLSPLLAYIAARIKLDSAGPVLFKQDRAGLAGSHFKVMKFRTMIVDAEDRLREVSSLKLHPDSAAFKAIEDPRVTKYGALLRRRSLDELPQLWNVLTGSMSLVGPRPLPLDEAAQVPPRYRAREGVRPGLTGPWQVFGRSDIPFEDMLKLDYMYVSTWSPRGDLKLLLRTVGVVLQARGAY